MFNNFSALGEKVIKQGDVITILSPIVETGTSSMRIASLGEVADFPNPVCGKEHAKN